MTDKDPADTTGQAPAQAPDLAERYGRAAAGPRERAQRTTPDDPSAEGDDVRPRPRLSVGARIATIVALTAGVALAAWFTVVDTQRDPVTFTDVGFSVQGPEAVDVTFDVSMPPGDEAVCTVTALSPSFAEVGAVDVEIPAADARTTRHTVTVATTELATTGVVDHCATR